jgi:hypothetical protein
VALYEEADSIIDNYSHDKKVVYGVVEADLSRDTKLTAGVTHQRKRSKGSLSYLGFPLFYSNGVMTKLPRSFSPAATSNPGAATGRKPAATRAKHHQRGTRHSNSLASIWTGATGQGPIVEKDPD